MEKTETHFPCPPPPEPLYRPRKIIFSDKQFEASSPWRKLQDISHSQLLNQTWRKGVVIISIIYDPWKSHILNQLEVSYRTTHQTNPWNAINRNKKAYLYHIFISSFIAAILKHNRATGSTRKHS
jgi:hypothetical protein